MSRALASQQQALLAALWAPRAQDAIKYIANYIDYTGAGGQFDALNSPVPDTCALALRGLQAYRGHGRELAVRALAGAYPVVAQLLGDDNFDALAKALWLAHPPRVGDMACWGGAFADLLAEQATLMAEDPYVPDVARVEWALHRAATAPDAVVDATSFALLAEHDPARLTLHLSPGWACVASASPVVSVVNAHLQADPPLAVAGQRLRDGVAETALVWRQAFKPRVRLAQPHEPAFLADVDARQTLAQALDRNPGFDFGGWLAPAAQSGLLVAVASHCQPISSRTNP